MWPWYKSCLYLKESKSGPWALQEYHCIHAAQILPPGPDGRSQMVPSPRWHSSPDAEPQSASPRPHSVWWWWPPWTPDTCWWSSVWGGTVSETALIHPNSAFLRLLGHLVLPLAGRVVQVGVAPVVVDPLLGLLVQPVELIGAVLHVVPQAHQVALASGGIGLHKGKRKDVYFSRFDGLHSPKTPQCKVNHISYNM